MRDMVDPYENFKTKKKHGIILYIAYIAESGEGEINMKYEKGRQMRTDRSEAFGGQTVKPRIECAG